MRTFNSIKVMLGLGLGFTIVIHAQSNSLWIQDGYGESGTGGNPVGIVLANEDVLGGFQFDLSYDHSLIQVEEVIVAGHIAGMDLYTSEPEPGILTVVVVSLNGELIIPKVSMILEIQYFVQGNNQNEPVLLGLTNVAFSDTGGITVPDVSADGFFFVEGVNSLRVENGFDSIPINLYNDFTAGGVQFNLSYDSNVVSLDQVQTTLRSEEMDLSFNEISSGIVTILLYSFDQNTITPGSGPVLNLLFENISEEYSSIALDLSNVAVSNEQGTTVEIDFYNGTYFIFDFSAVSVNEGLSVPVVYTLHQNYPNPFNPVTTLRYDLPKDAVVNITIYDMMGRQVKTLINNTQTAGYKSTQWNATNNTGQPVSAGLYLYTIQAGEFRQTKKMVLLK
jgi:hypothetical protein